MKRGALGIAAALFVLAGCASEVGGTVPPTQRLLPSTDTPTPPPAVATATPPLPGPADLDFTATAAAMPVQAQVLVGLVMNDLAASLNVASEEINLRAVESVTWSDAGLGCERDTTPDEGGVEGYRILLEYQGQTYEYHTDITNRYRACRSEGEDVEGAPILLDPVLAAVVEVARQHLAERLDLPPRRVFLEEVTPFRWPDSSLGCPLAGQEYVPTPVLGYRIVLRVGRQNYLYHSNYRQVFLCPEEAEVLPDLTPTPEETTPPTES